MDLEYLLFLFLITVFCKGKLNDMFLLANSYSIFIVVITSEGDQFTLLESNCTICPAVTFECIAASGGATIWNGTAFKSCDGHSIDLLHDQFNESSGSMGSMRSCNNGALVAWVNKSGNHIISQLKVLLSVEIIGSNIKCFHDDHHGNEIVIGQSLLGGIHCNSVKNCCFALSSDSFTMQSTSATSIYRTAQ